MIEGSGQNSTPNFNGPSQFGIISPASLMHTSCSNLINKCLIDDSRDINWQPLTFGRLAVHPDVTSQGLDVTSRMELTVAMVDNHTFA